MTTFNDIKIGEKFSTKAGQYVKTGPTSFYGFLMGEFVESERDMDGDIIPCGSASYLESVALNHCSELQGIIETMLDEDEQPQTDEVVIALDSKARALKTGCTEVGEVVAVTTAMAYCVMRGITNKYEAEEKFKKWTDLYPDWTENLVVTLMYDTPVCPCSLQDYLDAGLTEEDYKDVPFTNFISFPEEDIVAAE